MCVCVCVTEYIISTRFLSLLTKKKEEEEESNLLILKREKNKEPPLYLSPPPSFFFWGGGEWRVSSRVAAVSPPLTFFRWRDEENAAVLSCFLRDAQSLFTDGEWATTTTTIIIVFFCSLFILGLIKGGQHEGTLKERILLIFKGPSWKSKHFFLLQLKGSRCETKFK